MRPNNTLSPPLWIRLFVMSVFGRVQSATLRRQFISLSLAFVLGIVLPASGLLQLFNLRVVRADSTPQTLPLSQDWSNTGLITANDNWSGVPGIEGFLGQDLTTATGTDPQTLLGTSSVPNDLDVIANQTNPNTLVTGGVAEFHSTMQAAPHNTNPTIALNGSGTADAPNIILYLNTTGQSNINVSYNLRDLDCSIDNAIQQVALQYRTGGSGNFTNLPAGYVSDATTGPSLCTAITPVSVTLPAAAENQSNLQVRIISTNAVGNDEWVGIDDISVTASAQPSLSINNVSHAEADSGVTTFTFMVSLSSNATSNVTFDIATADGTAQDGNPGGEDNDYVAKSETGRTITTGNSNATFTVDVNGDATFEPDETFFVNVTNVTGAVVSDGQGLGTITNDDCPITGDVVISQVYGGGGNSGATFTHDFIELFNQGATTVSLSGWSVQYASASGASWQVTPLSGSIAPGGYYLVQEAQGAGGTTPLPAPDAIGTIAMAATAGKVALSSTTIAFTGACPTCAVDLVGYGGANCFEGAGPTAAPSNTTAALRKRGGCFDSDDNNVDFSIGSPNPRNSSSPTNDCMPITLAIHDIQGNGATTPYAGEFVSTTGIVTALKANGFFLQDLQANHDLDPATSEGIFVFTSSAPTVAVGNAVAALGTAGEFFNLTQLDSSLPGDVSVTSPSNPLPPAVVLTTSILDPAGTPDQLERFEGMRMHADTLVSVAPTNNFGETFTVLDGVPRPLREPGIEISLPVPPDPTSGMVDCCIPRWDENPERIMIDSDGLMGSSVISVTSNVTFSNITGPLDFTFGNYKVLPETPPTTTANMSAVPVPTPAPGEFTVAGYNIENFNNNATQRHKAALAIRDVMHLPDIIGTIEIFELSGLEALANEIESISGVHYEARLIEADGTSGDADQDVGFLIKTSRVQIDSVTQVELAGCDGTAANCNTFIDPNTNQPALLNDRPPLVLRATVTPAALNPLEIIVVVNHLRSFIDIETVTGEGVRVRAKRKAQSEFLADLLQDLQTDNPTKPVMSIGDYNAYQFSDGFTDPVATIKGTPTADDEVVVDQSPDLVSPDFTNLTDGLPADQRYSFIFEGTPQAIDHFIINTVANSMFERYAIARNNTDFPEVPGSLFANDATRPERNSDHDMPVAYFTIPKAATTTTVDDATAVFSPTDQTVTLTANVSTAAGTVNEGTVTFTVTNAGNAVVGSPVVGSVSGGVATAMYTLPGGTLPQALTITGDFSGSDTLNASTGTGTLSVTFGICLLYDPTKAVKSGAVYPIKIQLCDINGNNVSSESTVVHAVGVGLISSTAFGDVFDAGNANPDNNFRFDSALGGTGGYIYNLKTTGLSTGTYNLYFTAGADPVLHAVQFQVK